MIKNAELQEFRWLDEYHRTCYMVVKITESHWIFWEKSYILHVRGCHFGWYNAKTGYSVDLLHPIDSILDNIYRVKKWEVEDSR